MMSLSFDNAQLLYQVAMSIQVQGIEPGSHHSKWDLVGHSGGSPGLENAVKRWDRQRTSKPVKSPYGVGRYWDMAVSPTRSHLLWVTSISNVRCYPCACHKRLFNLH